MNESTVLPLRPMRPIRSFCRRESPLTKGRKKTLETLWPLYGLSIEGDIPLDLDTIFGRKAPRVLEIGFGDGQSLYQMAINHPEKDFIGIEVYRTGVATLLNKINEASLSNIRIFCADAHEVIRTQIGNNSLNAVHIYFPDPWPKKRHHKRRIIQSSFVELLAEKLEAEGLLHLATDWEDYANHMMSVMLLASKFENTAGPGTQFSERPSTRVLTKYEERGNKLGHDTWDLIFKRSHL